ncbi:hypothetical protein [Rhizobium sp. L1K21]|uniref:hypothetical protein n=1 Tax=Rhizobium sp. L1K21 TaxID=2954933 RepID=UPI002093EF1A|nr:hypothetical protein [Rhizobium sp. L1K21]MCO6187802.1 hypothetical protein [Rhizobium sp. L1K21]
MTKDDKKTEKEVERDAGPQFVQSQHGRENNGVDSAKPRVITHSDDATIHKWYPGKEDPPEDWDATFDTGEPPRKPGPKKP